MKKTALLLLVLLTLCALVPAQGLGARERTCYWQLDSVTVSTSTDPQYVAHAETDFVPLKGLSLEEAADAVRGDHKLSLGLSQTADSPHAEAEFTLRGIAPIVPGGSSMNLSVTGDVEKQKHSFYIYAMVYAGDERIDRLRHSGAWVIQVPFPQKAEPGDTHEVFVLLRELDNLARVEVTLNYRAHAGEMVMDTNGDALLYASRQSKPERIPQSVEDLLTSFTQNISGDGILFAAEKQDDGSVLVTLDPASGLSQEELIRLIRAAVRSGDDASGAQSADAVEDAQADEQSALRVRAADAAFTDLASATFSTEGIPLSDLKADADNATLYITPGARLTDSALSALLSAVAGNVAGTSGSLRDAAMSGELSLGDAEATPVPQKRSYSELLAGVSNRSGSKRASDLDVVAGEATTLAEQVPQAVVLYDKNGVVAAALAPGSETSGNDLIAILDRLRTIYPLRLSRFEQIADTTDGFILPDSPQGAPLQAVSLESGNLMLVLPGSVRALLDFLDAKITDLTATPEPTATPTPTPVPTPESTPTPDLPPVPTPTPVVATASETTEDTASDTWMGPLQEPALDPTQGSPS